MTRSWRTIVFYWLCAGVLAFFATLYSQLEGCELRLSALSFTKQFPVFPIFGLAFVVAPLAIFSLGSLLIPKGDDPAPGEAVAPIRFRELLREIGLLALGVGALGGLITILLTGSEMGDTLATGPGGEVGITATCWTPALGYISRGEIALVVFVILILITRVTQRLLSRST